MKRCRGEMQQMAHEVLCCESRRVLRHPLHHCHRLSLRPPSARREAQDPYHDTTQRRPRRAPQVRDKDERAKLLQDELEKMPKNVNRNLYTYRIMDIINSIAKQKTEIDKIIQDVRQVQKDINSIGERLQRAEVLADEKIFVKANQAKKDPAMVQSYRYLSDLRAKFDDLIDVVSGIGRKESEARDLEGKTAQLLERVSKNNIERILEDLGQVQAENQTLIAQIRAKKNASA